jgi:hypothetical protein
MPIEIVVTDELVQWWESLDEDEQVSVRSVVDLSQSLGVTLDFAFSMRLILPAMRSFWPEAIKPAKIVGMKNSLLGRKGYLPIICEK